MRGKRLLLARAMVAMRIQSLFPSAGRESLLIFNYHRLRGSEQGPESSFDNGVFGPDEDTFRRQMAWLRANTRVLRESDLIVLGEGGRLPDAGPFSAVTFDDGYIDCFTIAKPILDRFGISGLFFIPVNMLETRRLGWWDITAYLLKKSTLPEITVDGHVYDLKHNRGGAIKSLFSLFKLEKADKTAALLDQLAAACEVDYPSHEEQSAELMTWDQIRQLQRDGHAIGSHTLSHRVLATLDPGQQSIELIESRRLLEAKLGRPIRSLAYPVGGMQHIDHYSLQYAREAGYRLAFTFNTGMATLPLAEPFLVPRVSANSLSKLQAQLLFPGIMGIRPASTAF